MAKDKYKRLMWLFDLMYHSDGLTLHQIQEEWEKASFNIDGEKLPRRTFIDYYHDLEDNFDISIGCNARRGYTYYIENKDEIDKNAVQNWLLSSFYINNVIQSSQNLKKRILFENIPSGNEYLMRVIDAMAKNVKLKITYKSIHWESSQEILLQPYCIKVFKQRWYVIGKSDDNANLRDYSLDRVLNMSVTEEHFVFPEEFSAEDYFYDSYGILVEPEELDVETIRIKVYERNNKRKYLRLLPLHHSQKEIEIHDDYSIFEFRVYPSYDFIQEIMSHKYEMEVLSPQWVREEFAYNVYEMHKMYFDDISKNKDEWK